MIESTSRYTFVTLRGGGLFVVDSRQTPMAIVAEYDSDTVHPNGCLGAEVRGKMYIDSGGGTPANVFEADLYAFPSPGSPPSNPPNMPAPPVVFSEDVEEADTHGATLTKHGRYLWVADRGRNFLFVVDTETDTVVNRIPLAGRCPRTRPRTCWRCRRTAPTSSCRCAGRTPLTADPHVSTGSSPGVENLKVLQNGRSAAFEAIAPVSNVDAGGVERADVHAIGAPGVSLRAHPGPPTVGLEVLN